MVKKSIVLLVCSIILISYRSGAQDMMDLFKDTVKPKTYTYATFKTTRIISSQSIENPAHGVLLFMISHHFGQLNSGAYEFYGLDQSTIRLGLEYGLTKRLAIGIGRSTYEKNIDGFLKYKIIRQSKGKGSFPLSLSYFSSINRNGLKWSDPNRVNYNSSRYSFTHQLLIASKINDRLSLQISPTLIHTNLVAKKSDYNDVFALGSGGRFKLSKSVSFNMEYFYVLPKYQKTGYYNSLAMGFDLETGGHVFQLYFTNSLGMFEKAFITETTGSWTNAGIHFGFNISRVFTIRK